MNDIILRAQDGDKSAMTTLIEENAKLIWSIVRRFKNRNFELEDLYEIGVIGFIKAIKRFDLEFETKLSTYAVPMIIGEIKVFLRDNGPLRVSRSLKELATRVRDLKDEYLSKMGIELSIDEVSKILEVDKEDIVMALDATMRVESIDSPIGNDDFCLGDTISSDSNEYDKAIDKLSLNKVLCTLDDIEKKVIIQRYYNEMTQTKVAEVMKTSQVQISRIEKRALRKNEKLFII